MRALGALAVGKPLGTGSRVCLLVLGMHRSGTSAVARVLSLLGAALPKNMLGPNPSNEAGHWEPEPLKSCHDRMLAELGSRWDDWRKLDFDRIARARLDEIKAELSSLIQEEYGSASLLVLKEPRICRFAPLYLGLLDAKHIEPRVVIPFRNPLAVFASHQARDGMSEGFCALLWLRHVLDAEACTRELPRAIFSYEALLGDWQRTVRRIATRLDLSWPRSPKKARAEIEAFLSSEHQHHAPSRGELHARKGVPEWVKDAYKALTRLEKNPDDESACAVLDRVREEFDATERAFDAALAGELSTREARHEVERAPLAAEAAELRSSLALRGVDLMQARAELSARDQAVGNLQATLAIREKELYEVCQARSALEGELDARQKETRALSASLAARECELSQVRAALDERQRETRALAESLAARECELSHVQAELLVRDETVENLRVALAGRDKELWEARESYGKEINDAETIYAQKVAQREAEIHSLQKWLASEQMEGRRLRQTLGQALAERQILINNFHKSTSWRLTRPLRGLKRTFTEREFRRQLPVHLIRGFARRLQIPISTKACARAFFVQWGLIEGESRPQSATSQKSISRRLTRALRGPKREDAEREFRRPLLTHLIRGFARRLPIPVSTKIRAKSLFLKWGLIEGSNGVEVGPQGVGPRQALLTQVCATLAPIPNRSEALYRILWVINAWDLQTQKYRVFNYANELASHSVRSVVVRDDALHGVDVASYDIVVLNRIAANDGVRDLVAKCKSLGIPVRYDIDDLVFCVDRLPLLRFVEKLPPKSAKEFRNGVELRLSLMKSCDYVSASTFDLVREIQRVGLPACVLPNTIGRADLEEFGNLPPKKCDGGGRVRIGYFSGTSTHEHDFACCSEALAQVLEQHPSTELLIVGELTLPPCFAVFGSRVLTKPVMAHRDMLRELATVDINLAPLELGNAFTACKSEVKIFEAALFAIPTIASPTPTFAAIIEHGESGLLAAEKEQWISAFETLVTDATRRSVIGQTAKERIVPRFAIPAAAEEMKALDLALIAKRAAQLPAPLSKGSVTRNEKGPLITIIGILYNKRKEVRYFLESLRRQEFPGPFEVLLVDDRSPDDSVQVAENFVRQMNAGAIEPPRMSVRILRNERNLGNCASRNRAIAEAKSDIICIVDADCMVNRSFLREHYRAHEHGDCDAAVGPMNIESQNAHPFAVLGVHEVDLPRRFDEAQLQDEINKDSFVNCITRNFSISRRFIRERLNGKLFDDLFAYSADPQSGFGWEDVEMGCRLYKAGARIRFLRETFSIHVSHPSTMAERTKPLRSLRNFRRLHEKHPDLILLARQWAIKTHDAIVAWAAANGLSLEGNDDAAFLGGIFDRYCRSPVVIQNRHKPLRVLTHRWHCPHQYELYRSGHDFTLVTGAGTALCDSWDWEKRPMPANAHFVSQDRVNQRDYDLAILHFDENVLRPDRCHGKVPLDWGATLGWFLREVQLPTLGICHGTPQFAGQYDASYKRPDLGKVDDDARRALVTMLKNIFVVCNSHQAKHEWRFARSTVVWHGFSPHDYPEGERRGGVLTMPAAALENRPHYNGMFVVRRVQELLGDNVPMEALRVADPPASYARYEHEWAESKFRLYTRAVGSFSVYVNPTLRSPMPRSRGEAMMLGLVSVSMRNHDVDLFIRNGINGFFADSPEELADQLAFLHRNPCARAKMSAASRRTAVDLFNQDRYLAEWSRIFSQLTG